MERKRKNIPFILMGITVTSVVLKTQWMGEFFSQL